MKDGPLHFSSLYDAERGLQTYRAAFRGRTTGCFMRILGDVARMRLGLPTTPWSDDLPRTVAYYLNRGE